MTHDSTTTKQPLNYILTHTTTGEIRLPLCLLTMMQQVIILCCPTFPKFFLKISFSVCFVFFIFKKKLFWPASSNPAFVLYYYYDGTRCSWVGSKDSKQQDFGKFQKHLVKKNNTMLPNNDARINIISFILFISWFYLYHDLLKKVSKDSNLHDPHDTDNTTTINM